MTFHKTRPMILLADLFVIFLIVLLLFEVCSRVLLKESSLSYGKLFGLELPPKNIVPVPSPPSSTVNNLYPNLVIDGKKMTVGDLWGILRPDPVLGWEPCEKARSINGWYRTNNLGARFDHDIDMGRVSDKIQILAFGDSFTQGSRLPQEETWAYQLSKQHPEMEVINFGVDAYGMGQSLLRYMKVQHRLNYNIVLFLFAPIADLWRDISTIRYLAAEWRLYNILPRFVLENGELRLVKSPYKNVQQFFKMNFPAVPKETRDHLKKYDRFYIPELYEGPPFLKHLISYKLLALSIGKKRVRELHRTTIEEYNSEAWQVTREIFASAKRLAAEDNADFIVAVLPTHEDIMKHKQDREFQTYWDKMVMTLKNRGLNTIDLLPTLSLALSDQLDFGYDGTHYGPKASALIAETLGRALDNVLRKQLKITPAMEIN